MKKNFLIGILMFLAAIGLVSAAPVIVSPGNQVIAEGSALTFNVACSIGADNGSIQITDNVSFGSLVPQNDTLSVFTWTPGYTDNGTYDVLFNASDSNSSSTAAITINVTNTNRAPSLNSGSITINSNEDSDTTTVSASDDDGDSLTYSLVSENTSQVDCSLSGTTLTANRVGDWTGTGYCEIRVSDGSLTDTKNLSIKVYGESKLIVEDLKVYRNNDRYSDIDEDDVDDTMDVDEVRPGDTLKFSITLENTFDEDDDDIDIEDIDIEWNVVDFDDGDDMEGDEEISKIKSEEKETVEFEFDVPYALDSDSYDMTIEIQGEDEDGDDHQITLTFEIEIDRIDDEVRITRASLANDKLSCDRTTSLQVEITNVGEDDQDEAVLTIKNTDLGIDVKQKNIDVESGTDDNEYTKTVSIDAADIAPGTYTIRVSAYYDEDQYDDDDPDDVEDVTLTVSECTSTTTDTTTSGSSGSSGSTTTGTDSETDTVVVDSGSESTTTGTTTPSDVIITEEESFTDSGLYVALLVVGILAVVGGGIFLVLKFLLMKI